MTATCTRPHARIRRWNARNLFELLRFRRLDVIKISTNRNCELDMAKKLLGNIIAIRAKGGINYTIFENIEEMGEDVDK